MCVLLFQQRLEHDGEAQESLRHGFSGGGNTSPGVQLGEAHGHAEPRQVLNGYSRTSSGVLFSEKVRRFVCRKSGRDAGHKKRIIGRSAVTKNINHFVDAGPSRKQDMPGTYAKQCQALKNQRCPGRYSGS